MQQLQNCLLDKEMIMQSDGTLYIGSFYQQHFQGYSLVINPDGCILVFKLQAYYYGLFKKSKPKDIGVYKLKNSCLKIFWGDDDSIKNVEDIGNIDFLHKIISFKNNCYGNKILIKINPLIYGVTKNQKYDGFTVMHYKNGDIYYGNIYKGKQDGEGIFYNNYLQEWYWNKYNNGKLISHQLYGKNLVPRELITKLFNKLNFKSFQITMVSLSNIQQLIINQLLLNNQQNHLSLASTVQSSHPTNQENLSQILIDDEDINNNNNNEILEILQDSQVESIDQELQIYNKNYQQDEIEVKLSKFQTEKALLRIEKQRQNKFLTLPSQTKSPKQQKMILSTKHSTQRNMIYKRSVSPIFTTVRNLFSVIKI